MLAVLVYIGVAVLIAAGLVGSVLPALPGPPLVLLGIFIFAWFDGFNRVGWELLVGLSAVTLFSVILDLIAGVWGVKKTGASRWATWGSILGGVLGLFTLGLLGLLLGTFLGAFLGELLFRKEAWGKALKAGIGSLVGFLAGAVAKVLIALGMVVVFLLAVF